MKLFQINQESLNVYQSHLAKAKEGIDLSQFVNQRKSARIEGSIGHVYVYGMLMRDAAPIDLKLGATDYADIIKDLELMVSLGARSVVLHVDSGGGTVSGCIEAAEAIQNCSVPVVAHLEGLACSAAYKLASGATWIVSSKSAEVGNIGSIMVWLDSSVAMAAMGLSFNCFTNDGATLKSTGHLDSLTEEQTEFLQDIINEAGQSFQDHVLANRPNLSTECFKAGWYSGQKAIDLGLVDSIGSIDDAVSYAQDLANLFDT